MPAPLSGFRKLGRGHAAFLLLAAWALFFFPHLVSSGVPYYRDNLLTLLPIKAFVGSELRAGRWPAWYPYEGLGMPFIGQVVTGFFHPHTLLSLIWSPPAALKIELLAAYLWGAAGAYRMARAWPCSRAAALGAAWTLGFTGYALGMSNALPYLLGVATLPWVGWASLRIAARPSLPGSAALAFFAALIFLGGDAQTFLLCPLIVLPALVRAPKPGRSFLYLACAAPLAALLVSAELLPAMALGPDTLRVVGDPSPTMRLSFALHPRRTLEFVLPHFVPDTVRFRVVGELLGGGTAMWSSSVFIGVVAVTMAIVAVALRPRQSWPWAAVAVGSTGLAFGDRGLLLGLCWKVLPLLSRFRYPEKYVAPACVAVALLVAIGLDAALDRPRAAARAAGIAAALFAAFAVCVLLLDVPGYAWRSAGRVLEAGDPVREAVHRSWLKGAASGAVFAGAVSAIYAFGAHRRLAGVLLPLLIFAEVWNGNGDQLPLVAREALELPSPFASAVRAGSPDVPPPRVVPVARPLVSSTVTLGDGPRWVATMRELLRTDVAALEGIASFGSDLPGTTVRDFLLLGVREERASFFGGRLGACHRVVDPAEPLRRGDEPIARNAALQLMLVRQPCVAAARLTGALPARNMDEALDRMFAGVPGDRVVWEGGSNLRPPRGEARIISWIPSRLVVRTTSDRPAALVVTQAIGRGWSARLDGAAVAIRPADVVLQAIEVPPGTHEIALDYSVPRGAQGLALSIVGLVACAAIFLLAPATSYLRSRREKMAMARSRNTAE